jgi:putative redox protein
MFSAKVAWQKELQFNGQADSQHTITVDGDGKKGNSPMELILIALCGCTASDVAIILQKKRQPVTALEVTAQAEKAPEPPRVYKEIRLTYRVKGRVSRKAIEDAVRLSAGKYCSVSAMLQHTAKLAYDIILDSDA